MLQSLFRTLCDSQKKPALNPPFWNAKRSLILRAWQMPDNAPFFSGHLLSRPEDLELDAMKRAWAMAREAKVPVVLNGVSCTPTTDLVSDGCFGQVCWTLNFFPDWFFLDATASWVGGVHLWRIYTGKTRFYKLPAANELFQGLELNWRKNNEK